MFSFFDFTPDNAVESWEVLKPAVEMFHGNAENYYSNVYGLFQENLLPKKFGGDITLTNILLPEVGNHILMHLSTKRVNYDNTTIKYDSVKLSEKELLVMLFTNYILSSNFQKIKIVFTLNSVYQYCCAAKFILMMLRY